MNNATFEFEGGICRRFPARSRSKSYNDSFAVSQQGQRDSETREVSLFLSPATENRNCRVLKFQSCLHSHDPINYGWVTSRPTLAAFRAADNLTADILNRPEQRVFLDESFAKFRQRCFEIHRRLTTVIAKEK